MAATNKLSTTLLLLLVIATAFVGLQSANYVKAQKICPQYCLDVEYMTCGSSCERLEPKCNCCLAPEGCTLHLADGTSEYCGNTT
ncbi:uncharacterized protein LOC21408157 isoform X1 [Morus notabilis]|uniref:uncharacterized protein LOC21408157 isoform X1 n=1 Tax=Morus notabilis TaxID=981085 RepID=UPI000CED372D|nr:uncharacterized protein LOC21408157 isoform X1 [Morus notabilis]